MLLVDLMPLLYLKNMRRTIEKSDLGGHFHTILMPTHGLWRIGGQNENMY